LAPRRFTSEYHARAWSTPKKKRNYSKIIFGQSFFFNFFFFDQHCFFSFHFEMYERRESCEMSGDDFFKFREESSGSNVRRASGETRSRPTSLSGFTIPSESEYLPCANETIYLCNFRVSVDGDWLCLKELPDTVSTTVAGHQLRYEQMAITPELERMTRYPNYPLHGKGISKQS
jgi:hypothetical protein